MTTSYTRTSLPLQWIVADATDLAAIVVGETERGCCAWQSNTKTLWTAFKTGAGAGCWALVQSDLEVLKFAQVAAAVNEITITNAVTTGAPSISATGDDTNISLKLLAKGTGVIDCSTDGIRTIQAVTNVHDTTPTDAELDTAFGTPAVVGRGFIGTVDDADADARMYFCVASDAGWYWTLMTKAS